MSPDEAESELTRAALNDQGLGEHWDKLSQLADALAAVHCMARDDALRALRNALTSEAPPIRQFWPTTEDA